MAIYPVQTRSVDPYSDLFSQNVNRISRIKTRGRSVIVKNGDLSVIPGTDQTTDIIITAGDCIIDDMYIAIEETELDIISTTGLYLTGTSPVVEGEYYLTLNYRYTKSRPAPKCGIVILRPDQHSLIESDNYLFLAKINLVTGPSTLIIDSLETYDATNEYAVRQFADTFAGIYPTQPVFDADIHEGALIYTEDQDTLLLGRSSLFEQLNPTTGIIDTTLCQLGDLAYVDSTGRMVPAIADSMSHFANGLVISVGTVANKAGVITIAGKAQVRVSGNVTTGDKLYLSETDAGRAQSGLPSSLLQYVGTALTDGTDNSLVGIWFYPPVVTSATVAETEVGDLRQYVGSAGPGDTDPAYTSTNIVTQGSSLTTAISSLDSASSANGIETDSLLRMGTKKAYEQDLIVGSGPITVTHFDGKYLYIGSNDTVYRKNVYSEEALTVVYTIPTYVIDQIVSDYEYIYVTYGTGTIVRINKSSFHAQLHIETYFIQYMFTHLSELYFFKPGASQNTMELCYIPRNGSWSGSETVILSMSYSNAHTFIDAAISNNHSSQWRQSTASSSAQISLACVIKNNGSTYTFRRIIVGDKNAAITDSTSFTTPESILGIEFIGDDLAVLLRDRIEFLDCNLEGFRTSEMFGARISDNPSIIYDGYNIWVMAKDSESPVSLFVYDPLSGRIIRKYVVGGTLSYTHALDTDGSKIFFGNGDELTVFPLLGSAGRIESERKNALVSGSYIDNVKASPDHYFSRFMRTAYQTDKFPYGYAQGLSDGEYVWYPGYRGGSFYLVRIDVAEWNKDLVSNYTSLLQQDMLNFTYPREKHVLTKNYGAGTSATIQDMCLVGGYLVIIRGTGIIDVIERHSLRVIRTFTPTNWVEGIGITSMYDDAIIAAGYDSVQGRYELHHYNLEYLLEGNAAAALLDSFNTPSEIRSVDALSWNYPTSYIVVSYANGTIQLQNLYVPILGWTFVDSVATTRGISEVVISGRGNIWWAAAGTGHIGALKYNNNPFLYPMGNLTGHSTVGVSSYPWALVGVEDGGCVFGSAFSGEIGSARIREDYTGSSTITLHEQGTLPDYTFTTFADALGVKVIDGSGNWLVLPYSMLKTET